MSSLIIGADPSLRNTGIIILDTEALSIREAWLYKHKGPLNTIAETLGPILDLEPYIDEAWVEYPQIYPGAAARHSDVLNLACVAGVVLAYLCNIPKVQFVNPRVWKGQASKKQTERIVRGKLKDVSAIEAFPKSSQNHLFDAAGVAIYGHDFGT